MARHRDDRGLVVHRNVSLMVCESAAVFEEAVLDLDLDALHVERVGARALLVPAPQLEGLREALRQRGVHPKVIGAAPVTRHHEE